MVLVKFEDDSSKVQKLLIGLCQEFCVNSFFDVFHTILLISTFQGICDLSGYYGSSI